MTISKVIEYFLKYRFRPTYGIEQGSRSPENVGEKQKNFPDTNISESQGIMVTVRKNLGKLNHVEKKKKMRGILLSTVSLLSYCFW